MTNTHHEHRKQIIQTLWNAAISTVSGQAAVERAIQQDEAFNPDTIIAVGKAAVGMCRGALTRYPAVKKALIVTKYGHADHQIRSR